MATAAAYPEPIEQQDMVVILGKEIDFLYVAGNARQAEAYVHAYLSGMPEDGPEVDPHQQGRATLDELEFFDARGRRLPVITHATDWSLGQPIDPERELRERIAAVYEAAQKRLVELQWELPRPAGDPVDLSAPDFVARVLVDGPAVFDPDRCCNWLLRALGLCG
jgi:hypothetical protein